jgi:uncharacterized protein YndB with AHSA1/START domain
MDDNLLLEAANFEIVTTRNVLATTGAVFKAWTEVVHLREWWSPKRFKNSIIEFDCRRGGKFHYILQGQDKREYLTMCEFMEVASPELLAWRSLSDPSFIAVARFQKVTKRITSITLTLRFASVEECASIKHHPMFNFEDAFDKLEQELERFEKLSARFKVGKN